VAAPEPTSAGRCGSKLQLTWQRVEACSAPCLDLELVCGGTRSSGCRQRPPGPPRERLRTRRWGQFFDTPLGYLELFTRQSTAGPREVPELEVREHLPSTLRNALTAGPRKVSELETWMTAPLGVLPACPRSTTTEVEDVDGGPL
jgi:hypothetical protein